MRNDISICEVNPQHNHKDKVTINKHHSSIVSKHTAHNDSLTPLQKNSNSSGESKPRCKSVPLKPNSKKI